MVKKTPSLLFPHPCWFYFFFALPLHIEHDKIDSQCKCTIFQMKGNLKSPKRFGKHLGKSVWNLNTDKYSIPSPLFSQGTMFLPVVLLPEQKTIFFLNTGKTEFKCITVSNDSLCILHMWRKHQIFPSVHLYLQQIDFTTAWMLNAKPPYKNVWQSLLSLKMYLSKQCGGMWVWKSQRGEGNPWQVKKDFHTSINQRVGELLSVAHPALRSVDIRD